MTYINGKYQNTPVETIDEFETYKEAMAMLKEYRMCMSDHSLWLSQRSTKEWRDSK